MFGSDQMECMIKISENLGSGGTTQLFSEMCFLFRAFYFLSAIFDATFDSQTVQNLQIGIASQHCLNKGLHLLARQP